MNLKEITIFITIAFAIISINDALKHQAHSRCETLLCVRNFVDFNLDTFVSPEEMTCARFAYLNLIERTLDREVESNEVILHKCDKDGDGYISEWDFYNSSQSCLHDQTKIELGNVIFCVQARDRWNSYNLVPGDMKTARAKKFPICGKSPKFDKNTFLDVRQADGSIRSVDANSKEFHPDMMFDVVVDPSKLSSRAHEHYYKIDEHNVISRLDGKDCFSFETDFQWVNNYEIASKQ